MWILMLCCADLLVVLQNGVDVSQLRVIRQKVNLMEVVLNFFPKGKKHLN